MSLNREVKAVAATPTNLNGNERKMIYEAFDLLLDGAYKADVIDFIRQYESIHVRQSAKNLVIGTANKNL